MRPINKAIVLFLAQVFLWGFVFAQERGTAPEAVRMAEKGLAHIQAVGLPQALHDFSVRNGPWIDRDLYIFVMNKDGLILAHAANRGMIGKTMLEVSDANGKKFVKEFLAVFGAKGRGWVDYLWPNPMTKKLEEKSTYLMAVPGHDCFVLVGIYRKK